MGVRIPQEASMQVHGRLTRDPEVKMVGDKKTCGFSIATDRWAGATKGKQTSFFNCRAWDRNADRAAELTKGAAVYVTGEPYIETYETKSGEKRSEFRLTVRSISPLEWPEDGDRQSRSAQPSPDAPAPDDDIPF